jgi:DNA-directed RNA polymerase subunit L/DNA-directed RNA polymerase alpha subunit
MSQVIVNSKDTYEDNLVFNLESADVSVPNALRRTILSNIETLVFRGFPYTSNHITFKKNTTKFNNEYLKQRISCIPIHVDDASIFDTFIQKYQAVIQAENKGSENMLVTTENIKIIDKDTKQEIPETITRKYFPRDPISEDFILICVLYPNFNSNEVNESIHIEANFDKGCAQENSAWNVVHHCAYENEQDRAKVEEMANEIDDLVKKQDFMYLDAQKEFIPNRFKCSVGSIGIYTNEQIVVKACDYINGRLSEVESILSNLFTQQEPNSTFKLKSYDQVMSESTNGLEEENSRDVLKKSYMSVYTEDEYIVFRLREDDYTIGKLLEKYYFQKYEGLVSFVGFKKNHPMQKEAFIYVKYKTSDAPQQQHLVALQHMNEIVKDIQLIFDGIKREFDINVGN